MAVTRTCFRGSAARQPRPGMARQHRCAISVWCPGETMVPLKVPRGSAASCTAAVSWHRQRPQICAASTRPGLSFDVSHFDRCIGLHDSRIPLGGGTNLCSFTFANCSPFGRNCFTLGAHAINRGGQRNRRQGQIVQCQLAARERHKWRATADRSDDEVAPQIRQCELGWRRC